MKRIQTQYSLIERLLLILAHIPLHFFVSYEGCPVFKKERKGNHTYQPRVFIPFFLLDITVPKRPKILSTYKYLSNPQQ